MAKEVSFEYGTGKGEHAGYHIRNMKYITEKEAERLILQSGCNDELSKIARERKAGEYKIEKEFYFLHPISVSYECKTERTGLFGPIISKWYFIVKGYTKEATFEYDINLKDRRGTLINLKNITLNEAEEVLNHTNIKYELENIKKGFKTKAETQIEHSTFSMKEKCKAIIMAEHVFDEYQRNGFYSKWEVIFE